ncbi:C3a anaphylatoxin chemotactic receptor-like [Polyodon spathula]|uniref:C3a anaphylatoxin chemotactic receptor-like n=1 Tax=Polyodon spathula TaxID=7913 RepID=UPI001B7E4253|nr:C3a anaphylatoxin chemotactic receptor-like [Polyodon spathula]
MELNNITTSSKSLPQKTDDSVDIDYVMDTVLIVLYTITISLGVTGNSIVIWMISCKLRKNVTNVWLLNLAVADLVFCFTRVISLLKLIFYTYWPFGEFLCKFNGFFTYMNLFCSVFLLSVISLDRCFSVVFPIRMRQWRTVQMASFASAGVWALATAFSLPYFLFRQVAMDPGNGNLSRCSFDVPGSNDGYQNKALYIVRFLFGFLVPFLIIATCYAIMACKLRQTQVPKKSFKIIAVLVAAFFFCWAPYHVFLLAKMVNKKSLAVKVALPLFKGLAYFNSCINPILYFIMALDLKKRFNQKLSLVYIRAFSEELDSSSHYRSSRRDRSSIANTVEVTAL